MVDSNSPLVNAGRHAREKLQLLSVTPAAHALFNVFTRDVRAVSVGQKQALLLTSKFSKQTIATLLSQSPPTAVGGLLFLTYDGQIKELFKTTNGSWWIVSSGLNKGWNEESPNYRWWYSK